MKRIAEYKNHKATHPQTANGNHVTFLNLYIDGATIGLILFAKHGGTWATTHLHAQCMFSLLFYLLGPFKCYVMQWVGGGGVRFTSITKVYGSY